ncbi:hypothetical protein SAY86_019365 [Trapa natans]|uniref:Uncharacterized protein n=1 Tax=Trapa natans TaxID=22666 RepID=A0AAN7M0A2_TRANT|nr:hypothetical protein SAY86_019365 [Trapa natans]
MVIYEISHIWREQEREEKGKGRGIHNNKVGRHTSGPIQLVTIDFPYLPAFTQIHIHLVAALIMNASLLE